MAISVDAIHCVMLLFCLLYTGMQVYLNVALIAPGAYEPPRREGAVN